MASGPGTTAITAALSPCSAAAALHYLSPYFFLHILSTPLLLIAVQNPNFCPCRGFLSTLFFFSSPLHPLSIPALPQDQLSARFCFPLVVSPCKRDLIPHAPFDLRTCSRQTNAFADSCRFEACSLSPFYRDTRHSFIQLLVFRALQTFSSLS